MQPRQLVQFVLLAASLVTFSNCRTPQEPQSNFLAALAKLTVTDKVVLDDVVDLKLDKKYNYVELDVTDTGLLQIGVTGAIGRPNFASAVKLSVAKASDPTVIEASGEVVAAGAPTSWFASNLRLDVKTIGKYLVLIDHGSQFKTGSSSLTIRSEILRPTPSDQIQPPSINGSPGSWNATLEYKGTPIRLDFLSSGLQSFEVSMEIIFASKNVINTDSSCASCGGKFEILDF